MVFTIKDIKIEGDNINGVVEFFQSLNDLRSTESRYSKMRVEEGIAETLVNKISEMILAERSSEIIKAVDIDDIIKRIQIKVVDRLINK